MKERFISENEKKNDVASKNQVVCDARFAVEGDGKTKVLLIGNSITRHGPAPEIGWYGDYGMAASAKEKDYVHVTAALLDAPLGGVTIGICQLADWERVYEDGAFLSERYAAARDFSADIVVVRIGENMTPDAVPACRPYFEDMIRYFAHSARTVVVTDSFWRNDARDEMLAAIAKDSGYVFCSLRGIEDNEENLALAEYEHRGVGGHPSDRGMKEIAERIASAILKEERMYAK